MSGPPEPPGGQVCPADLGRFYDTNFYAPEGQNPHVTPFPSPPCPGLVMTFTTALTLDLLVGFHIEDPANARNVTLFIVLDLLCPHVEPRSVRGKRTRFPSGPPPGTYLIFGGSFGSRLLYVPFQTIYVDYSAFTAGGVPTRRRSRGCCHGAGCTSLYRSLSILAAMFAGCSVDAAFKI